MHEVIGNFVKALRGAGVPVAVSESLDALNAAALVGYGERTRLKDALSLALAKTEEHKATFDACFDLYFSRDRLAGGEAEADDEPADDAGERLAEMLLSGDNAGLAAAMEGAANRAGVGEIRYFSQRGILARRMLEAMGLRELEALIASRRLVGDEAGAEGLEAGRRSLIADGRDFVERQYRIYGEPASERLREESLAEQRLAAVDPRELALMQRLVRRMAKRLAAKYARRRRAARRGDLDLRRMLRRNVAFEGVPFNPAYKQRKRARTRVIAICDVSRSVAAVARFLLLFLYSLNEVIDEFHPFAFSDHLVAVGSELEGGDAATSIGAVLDRVGFRSTDYGRALADFMGQYGDLLDRRTTVIVLGDARSNNTDPRLDLMRAIEERAKRVIWLNPENPAVWGSGDSEMERYRRFCQVARECASLKQLERSIDELLRLTV